MKKNNCIKILLNPKNEFRTEAAFSLNGILFSEVNVKIDTGCPKSSFPMLRLGISETEAYMMKLEDSKNRNIKKNISFGVNDSRTKKEDDKRKFKAKRYMELNSISFRHTVKDLSIAGMHIGDFEVSVSYDRIGNILIGMDILRTLDIHMGTLRNGETILLACPGKCLSDEYRSELQLLFDVKPLK